MMLREKLPVVLIVFALLCVGSCKSLKAPEGFDPAPNTGAEPYMNTGRPLEIIHRRTGIAMVFIPAGEFTMGSPETEADRDEDEIQHFVKITKPFYMAKYEVTQGAWRKLMAIDPWRGEKHVVTDANNPAVYVSWNASQEFLKRAGGGLVLPTEAQWEYACRVGTRTAFYFGSDVYKLSEHARFDLNTWNVGSKHAHRVGMAARNPWGLFDMHGNVYEWCSDWYSKDYYKRSPVEDPKGPVAGAERVIRGGAFYVPAKFCRSANRNKCDPSKSMSGLGFRPIRPITEAAKRPRPPSAPRKTPDARKTPK